MEDVVHRVLGDVRGSANGGQTGDLDADQAIGSESGKSERAGQWSLIAPESQLLIVAVIAEIEVGDETIAEGVRHVERSIVSQQAITGTAPNYIAQRRGLDCVVIGEPVPQIQRSLIAEAVIDSGVGLLVVVLER